MSVTPPDHFSPSAWSLWDQCAWAWHHRYILGVKGPPTVATEVGTFAHKVFELLFERGEAYRTIPGARELAGRVWKDPGEVDLSVAHPLAFKQLAWAAIKGLWDLEQPERVAVVAREQRVRWPLGSVTMEVVVDRVERNSAGLLAVTDYKTGKHKARYQVEKKRQITVGALAVQHLHGAEEVGAQGRLLYTTAGKVVKAPTDQYTLVETTCAAEKAWWDITEACKHESFEPTPGPLCDWCSALDSCEVGQRQVEVNARRREAA